MSDEQQHVLETYNLTGVMPSGRTSAAPDRSGRAVRSTPRAALPAPDRGQGAPEDRPDHRRAAVVNKHGQRADPSKRGGVEIAKLRS